MQIRPHARSYCPRENGSSNRRPSLHLSTLCFLADCLLLIPSCLRPLVPSLIHAPLVHIIPHKRTLPRSLTDKEPAHVRIMSANEKTAEVYETSTDGGAYEVEDSMGPRGRRLSYAEVNRIGSVAGPVMPDSELSGSRRPSPCTTSDLSTDLPSTRCDQLLAHHCLRLLLCSLFPIRLRQCHHLSRRRSRALCQEVPRYQRGHRHLCLHRRQSGPLV